MIVIICISEYIAISENLVRRYSSYQDSIHSYMMIEFMAMIVSNGKNKIYNFEMIHKIQKIRTKAFIHVFEKSGCINYYYER